MTRASAADVALAALVVAAWSFGRRPAEIVVLGLGAAVTVRAIGIDRRSLRLPNAATLALVALAQRPAFWWPVAHWRRCVPRLAGGWGPAT
jgi:hypothetical protein